MERDREFDDQLPPHAARGAFQLGSAWRTMDASMRGKLIIKLADLMERDREYIAQLDTVDNGKTLESSLGDVDQSISTFMYYGDTIPTDGSVMTYNRMEPVGVVGQIIPWNYPVAN